MYVYSDIGAMQRRSPESGVRSPRPGALVISGEWSKSLITFIATPRRRSPGLRAALSGAGRGRGRAAGGLRRPPQSVPRSGCAQACADTARSDRARPRDLALSSTPGTRHSREWRPAARSHLSRTSWATRYRPLPSPNTTKTCSSSRL